MRQDLAVTGSVNQHGDVQAIGGVNEKIEGFFDICAARGLSGTQGVLIPASERAASDAPRGRRRRFRCRQFSVYPIATIDEGIALLSGRPAGERGADGTYADASVNRLVEERLRQFAAIRREAAERPDGNGRDA